MRSPVVIEDSEDDDVYSINDSTVSYECTTVNGSNNSNDSTVTDAVLSTFDDESSSSWVSIGHSDESLQDISELQRLIGEGYEIRHHALRLNAANGNLEVVKFLMENGDNLHAYPEWFDECPLVVSAANGHLDVVKFLLENGYANTITIGTIGDDAGSDALVVSAANGHLDVVKILVENVTDAKALDIALYASTECGHLEVVRYLVENGANVHRLDVTSLHYCKSEDIIKYLIIHGADTTGLEEYFSKDMQGFVVAVERIKRFFIRECEPSGSIHRLLYAPPNGLICRKWASEWIRMCRDCPES